MTGSRPSPGLPTERRLALVVATATYRDTELRQLRAPARDAADLGQLLADPDVGGFDVTTVLDRSAQQIRLAIEEFLTDRRPDDLVVVYLSCHGLVDARRRLYFAARDTLKNRLASTGVEAEWLLDQLEDCRARRQVVILDCCFSGAFVPGAKGDDDLGLDRRFGDAARGRVVLTASRGTEYSFEGEPLADAVQPGSVFTNALVAGIRTGEADRDRDGYISVDEAFEYVFDQLRSAGAAQTPQRTVYRAEGKILLARSPAGVPVDTTPLPEHLRSALDSPLPSVRLAGVKELGELLDDPTLGDQARATLKAIAAQDVPEVAIAAKALLVPPRPETPPARPEAPSRRWNIPIVVGTALAVAIALTLTFLLVFRPNETAAPTAPAAPEMYGVAYSPDGKVLAAAGQSAADGTAAIRLWNTANWQATSIPLDRETWVRTVAFSPDGMILAAASSDGVRLFDATSRKLVGGPFGDNPAPNTQHGLTAMAFSPDGKTMAVGRWDGSIQIWDLASHAPIGPTMTGHAGEISGLAFSPDGKVLASGGATTYTGNNNYAHDNTVRLWDTTTHQQIGDPLIRVGADNTAPGPAFAPEGEKLAVAYSPGDGLVWNIGTQRPAGTLTGTDGLNSAITYSHAGALIADGDGHNVRLWDATTYRQLRDLKGHTNDVYAVAFSPDDSRLASASRDGTVRVWDPATGALVKQFTP